MAVNIPWRLHWTTTSFCGSHPSLPGWTIDDWSGDLNDIKKASLTTFMTQMLHDRMIDLELAATHRMDGWCIYVPVSPKYRRRCELWDALWRVRIEQCVPTSVVCRAIGVTDIHDVIARLSPIRSAEMWSEWHAEVYSVLQTPPWDE